uniref:Large ribosomal subunit protein mL64 n=1 Tax=Fopius arisanus TaxID=64838 RepID=A0A0C9QYI1_9HYME
MPITLLHKGEMLSVSVRSWRQCTINLYRTLSTNTNEYQDENGTKNKKVNRSMLLTQHRNVLFDIMPYNEPSSWIHLTEKYKKKLFGRYGLSSEVDPSVCFNAKSMHENDEKHVLEQMLLNQRNIRMKENQAIKSREVEIAAKLEKLEQWKLEMRNKIAKKEADALAAKQQKQRLIEEVRRHFGFNVDPRDERFKEMLEQKEREEKKKQKEAKRKAKEDKMMARTVGNNSSS